VKRSGTSFDADVPPFKKRPRRGGACFPTQAASRLFLVLLAGIVLSALLGALTGLLRLLVRVALLAALVRIALVLLSTLVLLIR
jgi:4-hydroxybenzoate polyprenyltransferase